MLYYSLIYPYLTYCNIAWASNYPSKFIPLLTLQKRITRFMFRLHPRCPNKGLFLLQMDFWIFIRSINSKLDSLYLIIILRPLIICFSKSSDIHSYNLISSSQFRSEFSRTTFKKLSICCQGPLLFSSLSSSLTSVNSFSLFKTRLKKYILSSCWDLHFLTPLICYIIYFIWPSLVCVTSLPWLICIFHCHIFVSIIKFSSFFIVIINFIMFVSNKMTHSHSQFINYVKTLSYVSP